MVLVFLQPDLGTALVYAAALSAVLLVAGVRWLHLALLAIVGSLVVAVVLWFLPAAGVEVLKPYQTARLTGFANPDADPSGLTYNVTQSITAIGAGGLDGRGPNGASQTRLDYLPEHATDFVFASFAEQRGFFGASILLLLYLLVVWRGLRVITLAGDLYGAVVAAGIVFGFLFQVFVNVGMTMGIAPVTGIPLALRLGRRLLDDRQPGGDRTAAVDPRPRPVRRRPMNVLGLSPGALCFGSPVTRATPTGSTGRVGRRAARAAAGAMLADGGDAGLVRNDGDPVDRCGARLRARRCPPRAEAQLRAATRAAVATVAVQTGAPETRVPYVLPATGDDVGRARGFRSRRSPSAVVGGLDRGAASLAARLPVLVPRAGELAPSAARSAPLRSRRCRGARR